MVELIYLLRFWPHGYYYFHCFGQHFYVLLLEMKCRYVYLKNHKMFFTSPFPVLLCVFSSVYTGVWTFLNEYVEIRALISWAAFVKTTIKTARCHHSKSTIFGGFCLLREPQLCKLYPTLCSTPHYLSIWCIMTEMCVFLMSR